MANLTSQSHGIYSQVSACPGEMEPLKDHPIAIACEHLTIFRKKPRQHRYLPEELSNVYSYHVMVKSMSCCCVCGSQLFLNPVTICSTSIINFKFSGFSYSIHC